MNVTLAHIHSKPNSPLAYAQDVTNYLKLSSRWLSAQSRGFASEVPFEAFLRSERDRPAVVLCASGGEALSSEGFAAWMGRKRDVGTRAVVIGIGPADGWSSATLARADLQLSLGRMTLPHALARLVMAEQIYRAATILGGHPYHLGH